MRKFAFSILMILLVLTSGAAFAQIIPPGPTQQQEPDLTNNNLPQPGNPQTKVEAPATEPAAMAPEAPAAPAGESDSMGTMDTTSTSTTGTTDDMLPSTASNLPLLGLIGLVALAGGFAVRRF